MFYLVASTYSHVLHGYTITSNDEGELVTKRVFLHKGHSAVIRTLCASSHTLLSGSEDETIKVYALDKRKEIGTLLHHDGSVGCIKFIPPKPGKGTSWVLSSGEDGLLVLWRISDWSALLTISAHPAAPQIHYSPLIAPHPTGRLCISLGWYSWILCYRLKLMIEIQSI